MSPIFPFPQFPTPIGVVGKVGNPQVSPLGKFGEVWGSATSFPGGGLYA